MRTVALLLFAAPAAAAAVQALARARREARGDWPRLMSDPRYLMAVSAAEHGADPRTVA